MQMNHSLMYHPKGISAERRGSEIQRTSPKRSSLGTVIGPYDFVPGAKLGHQLPVQWDDLIPRQIHEGKVLLGSPTVRREAFFGSETASLPDFSPSRRTR
jgi:hypothetical protein